MKTPEPTSLDLVELGAWLLVGALLLFALVLLVGIPVAAWDALGGRR